MKNVIILLVLILMLSCSTYKNKDTENSFLIAYNVHIPAESDNDNYEIFTIEKDGSNPSRLTNHPDVAWTYLAVDDKILFISDRDTCYRCFYLYEMKSDGSKLRKITDFALADSWMGSRFDGRELIVRPAKDSVFYIIDRKGVILNVF
jgi:TolB protein